ncbi:hypothetical protein BR93DRAFT_976170 [Coniochaeta sp. PMI_546]|nr:hypothetical protein BR93DRAFT_976170 [Coniochaeta sp. PMI_546]
MDSPHSTDRDSTTPFLLKLFYRTGTFHRPDEFASTASLPPHLPIHTYMTTTLLELAHHIASLQPSALPSPAIGTRLSFRLIYPDTTYTSRLPPDQSPPPRYLAKDLGSLVLGEGGPGIDFDDPEDVTAGNTLVPEVSAAGKTLTDAKFVVGDYLSVAVLPPDGSTGAVVPASGIETTGRAAGRGSASAIGGVVPPPPRRDNGFPVGPSRGGRGGRGGRFGREREQREWEGRGRDRDQGGHGFPEGEWRRGERLPDAGLRGGRRGSRW